MFATHRYKKKPDGTVGNELDLSEGETLVYLMKHDDKDHWWLPENGKGQVVCASSLSYDHHRRGRG